MPTINNNLSFDEEPRKQKMCRYERKYETPKIYYFRLRTGDQQQQQQQQREERNKNQRTQERFPRAKSQSYQTELRIFMSEGKPPLSWHTEIENYKIATNTCRACGFRAAENDALLQLPFTLTAENSLDSGLCTYYGQALMPEGILTDNRHSVQVTLV
ncbi:hypothetical protein RUM44_000645 [Polyplax serrata]|uniref:Uncharacterized protein n=1 Tax=Polyplax serrata TaxID=468196 RepID=A0ABR1B891_POLSC